jgi:hypothetical protein
MSTSTLEGGHVVVSDAAGATVTAARSVADDGIDIDDPTAAAISDDAASTCWKKRSAIKTKPRILVLRHSTRYYNLV